MTSAAPHFYFKTSDAWEAMYKDCEEAQHSIEFEQYILLDDSVGSRFLQLFAEKARAGLKIRLMLDSIGSRGMMTSKLIRSIHEAGGEVRFYNPISLANIFVPSSWYPRNHAKTLLIDDRLAYIGSACISAEMQDWNDLHMRFTGDLAQEVKDVFAAPDKVRNYKQVSEKNKLFRYAVSHPHLGRNPFFHELLEEINGATKSVYLVSPYFLPPWRLRHALYKAIKRGVDVRVMISEKTDVAIADCVSRTYFRSLIRRGVKVFLYQEGMLHSKYVVIDDKWATIGSSNMDYLSLISNREGNVIIRDQTTVGQVKKHFEDDLGHCCQVTARFCRDIPLGQRLLGWICRPIKRIL